MDQSCAETYFRDLPGSQTSSLTFSERIDELSFVSECLQAATITDYHPVLSLTLQFVLVLNVFSCHRSLFDNPLVSIYSSSSSSSVCLAGQRSCSSREQHLSKMDESSCQFFHLCDGEEPHCTGGVCCLRRASRETEPSPALCRYSTFIILLKLPPGVRLNITVTVWIIENCHFYITL